MDFMNLILGILLVIGGIGIIIIYEDIRRKDHAEGFFYKLQHAGIAIVVAGICYIVNELLKL